MNFDERRKARPAAASTDSRPLQSEELAGVRGTQRHLVLVTGYHGCDVECVPGNRRCKTGCCFNDKTGWIDRPGEHHIGVGLCDGQRQGEKFKCERIGFGAADNGHPRNSSGLPNLQVVAALRQFRHKNVLHVVHQAGAARDEIAVGGVV